MRTVPSLLSTLATIAALSCATPSRVFAQNNVYTYHYDNARTGANLNETVLTPANVNQNQFGKLFSHRVDGAIYAQPLYVAGVPVPGLGTHNVVYVATEHGTIYAFDADTGWNATVNPLWQISVINPAAGVYSLAGSINPARVLREVCITGTPVIDPSTNTMYFVAQTYEVTGGQGSYVQRLHAIDIRTGAEQAPFPVTIAATVPGTDHIPGNTTVIFNAQRELQRAALVLSNGVIYIGWCGITEDGRHGWIMGYNAMGYAGTPGVQCAAFCTTPNANLGGVWGSGNGLAADAAGNLFTVTGNGKFDGYQPNDVDFGQSVLKLSTLLGLTVADYFTPFNNVALSNVDADLGSGGALLLPDSAGSAQHPHLMVTCGKEGRIYLLDRDNLGGFNATSDNVVEELPNAVAGTWSSPTYWSDGTTGYVYYAGGGDVGEAGDYLKAFSLVNGLLSPTPTSVSSTLLHFPGATPTVSANGTQNAIVWILQTEGYVTNTPAVLHAYDALNVANELYNSNQAGARDALPPPSKFAVPVVANGKVYVGTKNTFAAYALLPLPAPTIVIPATAIPNRVPGASTSLTILGADTPEHGGEANLTYWWSAVGTSPGQVTFSSNGTNASKSTMATFSALGTYKLKCTIQANTGLSTTSTVTVSVVQAAAVTQVSPSAVGLYINGTQAFTATGIDQFGGTILSTAPWKWYLDTGSVGNVNKLGVYSAGPTAGAASVRAQLYSTGNTANVNVTVSTAPPTVAQPAACTPNPLPFVTTATPATTTASGTTATLTVLGADLNGEASLKYKWSYVGTPPGKVTFSPNGSNAAKTTTATFGQPGVYNLLCTITGVSGATVTSPITVTVN